MNLTTTQTRQLTSVLGLLTQRLDAPTLRQRLVEPLAELMHADYVASFVWDADAQRFGQGVCCRSDETHLRLYESQYQFSDPIAVRLHPLRSPTRVTQVMAQRDLVQSEFFDRFLDTGSMYWGVNLYAHDGRRDLGDLRIWRARAKSDFDSNELDMLRLLYPCLVNALTAAEGTPSGLASVAGASSMPAPRAEQLRLQHGLSAREAQVATLVARGHSDKEIARLAGVGFASVRTYLSNVLRKTGCSNRKALIAQLCSSRQLPGHTD